MNSGIQLYAELLSSLKETKIDRQNLSAIRIWGEGIVNTR